MFSMYPETKFQLDPTKDIEFSHRPPLRKLLTFGNVMYVHDIPKSKRFFLQWGSMEKVCILCRIQLKIRF